MLKLLHLNYHYHSEFSQPEEVIEKHKLSSGFVNYIRHKVEFISVKHLNYKGKNIIDGIHYFFFRSRNLFWHIPFATHRLIKNKKPDVILVEGFVFPVQVLALRIIIGKHCKIIAQHHGERPFKNIKGFVQRIANKHINAFIFTSLGNAKEWIEKRSINKNKCYQVFAASTDITRKDKKESKIKLGLSRDNNFLWVGRLNANKDPLTVLAAFEKYLNIDPLAKFFIIYQTEELLPEIKIKISKSYFLKRSVVLIGKKDFCELANWYNAADFFISGSHREAAGYALVEAMACGCIPVVTNIPSFNKITENGKYGILYNPGDADDLYKKFLQLKTLSKEIYSDEVYNYCRKQLSYEAISNQIHELCLQLISK